MPMTIVDYKNYTNKIGTFYKNSKEDMELLANLRRMVVNLNKDLRDAKKDYQFYVKCQGRLGKNNPNAPKYRNGGYYGPNAGSIRLPDAERLDAYIYRRR
jgi:hypothetical protein